MANSFFRARKGITVANSTASANLSPTTLTIGTTEANSTGVYTGIVNATTVNAATFQVGTAFTGNSTVVNAAAINSRGQINTVTFFAETSANVGANVQLTTAKLSIGNTLANVTANSIAVVIGNTSVNVTVNATSFSGTSNNSLYLGGLAAADYQTEAGLAANVATMTSNNANYLGGTAAADYQTEAGLAANVATMSANNSAYLGGLPASSYANTSAPSFTTLSVGANVQLTTTQLKIGNTTANLQANSILVSVTNSTATANLTPAGLYSPNVYITGMLSANGGIGSPGQILKTDGSTKSYWADQSAANPAGLNKHVQINDGGSFGANAQFMFDITNTILSVGNGTSNVQSNATVIRLQSPTASVNLTSSAVYTPNVYITGLVSANGTIGTPGQILKTDGSAKVYWETPAAANPAGALKEIQFNDSTFGANALFTFDKATTTLQLGNSTVNAIHTNALLRVANSTSTASIDALGLSVGTSVVNSVVVAAGANVVLGVNDLRVGNSTVNTYANSSMVRVTSAAGSANITPTNILVSNVTITGALSANGGVGGSGEILKSDGTKAYWGPAPAGVSANGDTGEIQYNTTDTFTANNQLTFTQATGTLSVGNAGSNVQSNSTQLKVANSTFTANLSPLALSIGIAKINATMVVVGSNVTIDAASLDIGNTTANLYANSVLIRVANSSGSANLDPIQLVIGTSKVNSTMQVVGSNVHMDSTGFEVGNSTVNVNIAATLIRVSDTLGNTNLTPTSMSMGNSAANLQVNSTSIRCINTTAGANLDPSQLSIGIAKVNSTMIVVGSNVSIDSNTLRIGNSSVNVVINSSTFNGTANNAAYLGGQPAANYVDISDLAGYQTEAGLAANVATMTANLATTALNANNASYLGGTSYLDYQTEAGLASNVATMTANNTSYVGTVTAANVVSNAQLSSNLANYATVAGLASNVVKLTANSSNYLGSTAAAGYQTTAGLAGNVAILTANNSNYLGGSYYTTYQTAAGLSGNVATMTANNANYLGGVSAADYQTESGLAGNVATMTSNSTTNFGGVGASYYVRNDVQDQQITGGARITEYDLGTGSGTEVPDPGDGPMQKITNNGTFTLSPSSYYGAYYLTVTNGASAGEITTSSWSKVVGQFTLGAGQRFRCGCSIGAGGSLLQIQAMQ